MWPSEEDLNILSRLHTASVALAIQMGKELEGVPEQEQDNVRQKYMPDWVNLWEKIPESIIKLYAMPDFPLSPEYIYHLIDIANTYGDFGDVFGRDLLFHFFMCYPDDVRCVIYAHLYAAISEDDEIQDLVNTFGAYDPDVVIYLFHRYARWAAIEHKMLRESHTDFDDDLEEVKQKLLSCKDLRGYSTHFF